MWSCPSSVRRHAAADASADAVAAAVESSVLLVLLVVLLVGCQILMVVSVDADASSAVPSAGGANATDVTAFVCPRSVASYAPVSQSHTRSVPSSEPLTSCLHRVCLFCHQTQRRERKRETDHKRERGVERERRDGCAVADERAPLGRVREAQVRAALVVCASRGTALVGAWCRARSSSSRGSRLRSSRGWCRAAAAEPDLHLERLHALLEVGDARLQRHDAEPALLERRERQRGRHGRGRLAGRALGLGQPRLRPQRVRRVLKVPRVQVLQDRVVPVGSTHAHTGSHPQLCRFTHV